MIFYLKIKLCFVFFSCLLDSVLVTTSKRNIDDCIREDARLRWNEIKHLVIDSYEDKCDESSASKRRKKSNNDYSLRDVIPGTGFGKFKLEGVYKFGIFRQVKFYRLMDEVSRNPDAGSERREGLQLSDVESGESGDESFDPSAGTGVETRCKGVRSSAAEDLRTSDFYPDKNPPAVYGYSMRPTRQFSVDIFYDSRTPSHAFNLKRKVDDAGLHTLPHSG